MHFFIFIKYFILLFLVSLTTSAFACCGNDVYSVPYTVVETCGCSYCSCETTCTTCGGIYYQPVVYEYYSAPHRHHYHQRSFGNVSEYAWIPYP